MKKCRVESTRKAMATAANKKWVVLVPEARNTEERSQAYKGADIFGIIWIIPLEINNRCSVFLVQWGVWASHYISRFCDRAGKAVSNMNIIIIRKSDS